MLVQVETLVLINLLAGTVSTCDWLVAFAFLFFAVPVRLTKVTSELEQAALDIPDHCEHFQHMQHIYQIV